MLSEKQRVVIQRLANGVFPLQRWIEAKDSSGGYDPRKQGMDAPWRQAGKTLRVEDTGAIHFLETVINDSALTEPLLERWQSLRKQPLTHSPFADVEKWREERNLNAAAEHVSFSVVESRNLWPGGGSQLRGPSHPESRQQFYRKYLDILVRTAELRGLSPHSDDGWLEFADDLFSDSLAIWPVEEVGPSSRFIEQFGRDLLYGMMNMTTLAAEPERSALMVELGEHRRPGNAFDINDCQRAIDALEKKIEAYCSKGKSRSKSKTKTKSKSSRRKTSLRGRQAGKRRKT